MDENLTPLRSWRGRTSIQPPAAMKPVGELWFVLLWKDGQPDPEYLSGPYRAKANAEYAARVTGVPVGGVKTLVSTRP